MVGRLTRGRGFTLVEASVCLAVAMLLIAGVLTLVRNLGATVRRQSQAADLQQSLRIGAHEISRLVRVAGRGGLAVGAVEVRDNVAVGHREGGPGGAVVAPETDVLILRGVFDGAVYEIASSDAESASSGSLRLLRLTSGDAEQDLAPLASLSSEEPGAALLLTGSPGSVGCSVVELTGLEIVAESARGVVEELALAYRTAGSDLAEAYANVCAPPLPLEDASRVGLLREYRYYVRRDGETESLVAARRLMRGRFLPGTDVAVPGAPTAGETLLDHALDLQVALGFDLDRDGAVHEATSGEAAGEDEWLGNEPEDDANDPAWQAAPPSMVRFTLFMRSARAEPRYLSPALDRIENRLYREPAVPAVDAVPRRFQRQRLETVVRRR